MMLSILRFLRVVLIFIVCASVASGEGFVFLNTMSKRVRDEMMRGVSDEAQSDVLMFLGQMCHHRLNGQSLGNYITQITKEDGLSGEDRAVRNFLSTNWRVAEEFGLVTPENISHMCAGRLPTATVGSFAGQPMGLLFEAPSEPGPTNGWITYRLVPGPLLDKLTEQAAAQLAASRAKMSPPNGGMQIGGLKSLNRFDPNNPNGNRRMGNDPLSNLIAANRQALQSGETRFLDVGADEPLQLSEFGAGNNHLHVNSASLNSGISFTIVDPFKTWKEPTYIDHGVWKDDRIFHTNAKHYHADWKDDPIPGSKDRGTYLISISGIQIYYVDTSSAGQNRIRFAIRAEAK